jgi:hypothetical protein
MLSRSPLGRELIRGAAGLALLCASTTPASARPQSDAPASPGLEWNARTVEHLYNRAGFGALPAEIEEGVRLGPDALIEKLMTAAQPWEDVEPYLARWEDFDLGPDQIPLKVSRFPNAQVAAQTASATRLKDRTQFIAYSDRWFASMIDHADPLRDRMTLFWHGFFTTSLEVVKRKYEMMQQHQWMRRSALSSFRELLHGLVEDPAMLQYLDNNTNVKGHPNENFARELMELYSLGEGNYSEVDVREAARALTGCTGNPDGHYEFVADRHDGGEKTILGEKGKFGNEELVDILLRQPACARYVTRKLMGWLEGVEPSPERLESYAAFLRENGYELKPFLKKLFTDPAFYRPEVIGTRVQGPIEFLVIFCRKLEITPPPQFLYTASGLLGQGFYQPPTVKGWDEGLGWITPDALMQRGNAAAVLLNVLEDDTDPEPTPEAMSDGSPTADPGSTYGFTAVRLRRMTFRSNWDPQVALCPLFESANAHSDAEIVAYALDRWLAIEPPKETRDRLLEFLSEERAVRKIEEGRLTEPSQASEFALRRFARMVFSLPEAQLE